ncbi:DUF1275 domain-containing protein [Tissierella creatinini]|nr:DUF1275 domain-containing protein [Tissierella creatinini]TJX65574.1 DUF1275 domain-containing protein [Soehngenia saccharolytica]
MESINHKVFFFSWVGSLTFLAGAINICAIVLLNLTVTHFTGNISQAAILLASGDINTFAEIFYFIILFFVGSTVSGFIYHEKELDINGYDAILPILFGIIIYVSMRITTNSATMLKIISLVMGIQNGMYVKIKGVLVRTTHMTGYLTDAGFCLGSLLQGKLELRLRFLFYILSILTFFSGGFISYLLIKRIGLKTLGLMAIIYCIIGLLVGLGILKEKKKTQLTIAGSND